MGQDGLAVNFAACDGSASDVEERAVTVETKPKRRRGGQPKPEDERKRNNITFRVRDDLREKLGRISEATGRTISEEIAHRISLTFVLDDANKDALSLRAETDENMKAVMHRRGWGKVVDPRYGGPVYVPPGQHALPQSGFVDEGAAAAPPSPNGLRAVVKEAVTEALVEAGLAKGPAS